MKEESEKREEREWRRIGLGDREEDQRRKIKGGRGNNGEWR